MRRLKNHFQETRCLLIEMKHRQRKLREEAVLIPAASPPQPAEAVKINPNWSSAQTAALLSAANHHLTRVAALADIEWKVALAFWTAQIAAGVGLLTAANSSDLAISYLVYSNSCIILIGYLVAVSLFIFGFSVNQSQSLSTERNRFLLYEAAALKSVGVPDELLLKQPKDLTIGDMKTLRRAKVRRSIVWAVKLAASTFFVLGAWMGAVTVAGLRSSRFLPLDASGPRIWAALNLGGAAALWIVWLRMTLHFFLRAKAEDR